MGFWDEMSGQQIYENFANAPGPARLVQSQQQIAKVAMVYTDRENQIRSLAASMEEGWTGDAAGAAQRGAGPLAVAHGGAAQEMTTANDLLSRQTESFYQVKSSVSPVPPAPEEPSTFKNIITFGGANSDYEAGVAKTNAVSQANVTAMDGWTSASSYNGTMMPTNYGQLDPNAMNIGLVEPSTPPPIGSVPHGGPPQTGGPDGHSQGPGTGGPGGDGSGTGGPGNSNIAGSGPGDGRTSGPPPTGGTRTGGIQTGDGLPPRGPGSSVDDGTTSSSFRPPTDGPGSPGWTGGPSGSGWSSGGGGQSGTSGGQGGQNGLTSGFGGFGSGPGGTGSGTGTGAGGRFGGTGSGTGTGSGSGVGSGSGGSATGSEKSLGGGKASGAGAPGESVGRGGPGASGAKGAGGRSGMPGAGMGGQKGEGGEDDEHQRKYVLDDDEAFQLTEAGERLVDPRTGMPLTPPVIGQ